MKKIISVILTLVLVLPSFAMLASVVPVKAAEIDFRCGNDVYWYIDTRNKVMTISGTGLMYDYDIFYTPWKKYDGSYNTVVIEEGVTYVSEHAFDGNGAIKTVYLPSTLERIGIYAFYYCNNLEEIVVADDCRLKMMPSPSKIEDTKWYKNQPEGPVYLGNVLLGYKGTMAEDTALDIKDGTKAVADKAFYNRTNLIDVNFPGTVEYIGEAAFEGTGWFASLPEGAVYADKVLYAYKGAPTLEEYDFVIKEGTVTVSAGAFESKPIFSVAFPDSMKYIGKDAFYFCLNLKNIAFTEAGNLEYIGDRAFFSCVSLQHFDLPQNVKIIGDSAFNACSKIGRVDFPASVEFIGLGAYSYISKYSVAEDNKCYSSDKYGVVFNKDKTVLYFAPNISGAYNAPSGVRELADHAFYGNTISEVTFPSSLVTLGEKTFYQSSIKKVNFSTGLTMIGDGMFGNCLQLKEFTVPDCIETIGFSAFFNCNNLTKVVIPANTKCGDPFSHCDNLTIYCYTDSSAHTYAIEKEIPFVLLDETVNTQLLVSLISKANSVDRSLYSDDSLSILDAALSAVDLSSEDITQAQVDEWETAIKSAIENLKYKPADYYAVDVAKERAEKIDRSLYTSESLARLDEALAAVETDADILNQDTVTGYARAINAAIDNLEYLPADYSGVRAAISESKKVNRRLYSQATLAVLDQSISAVDYNLNITEQAKVDGFAKDINAAVSALGFADIVLRNEPNGVIVSATAKELDPDTVLTVDLKDSSDLQSGNIAVGGTVKSMTLYDINLFLSAQKTQPNGFVTVKIKLPTGVDPKRCKVYHVIDDPVDPLVRYSTSLEGNFIVFETDHFSEFAVIEVETVLNGVGITKLPNKTVYAIGETVNTAGLEVTANYSDGTAAVVADYDVSSVDTSSVGTKAVTVYYTYNGITKSDVFEITVSAEKLTADICVNGECADEYNKKVAWYKGYSSESVKLDCTAQGNYKTEWSSDNPKVLVDSDGNVTNKGFFFARKAVITVKITDSAGNVIATDSITVRFYKFNFQLNGIQSVTVQGFRRIGLLFRIK